MKNKCSKFILPILVGMTLVGHSVCQASFFSSLLHAVKDSAKETVRELPHDLKESLKETVRELPAQLAAAHEEATATNAQITQEQEQAQQDAINLAQKWLADARNGDVKCYQAVAEYYENGSNGFEQNWNKAFYWYKKAAEEVGDLYCKKTVANCYLHGIGVERNWKAAKIWFEKCAEQGNDCALYLGDCYMCGESDKEEQSMDESMHMVPSWTFDCRQDAGKAFSLYSKLIEKCQYDRNLKLMVNLRLGYCYMNGYGCKEDGKKAWEMFNNVVEFSDKRDTVADNVLPAYLNHVYLALCYHDGIGCGTDIKMAKKILKKAKKLQGKISDSAYWTPVLNFERHIYNEIQELAKSIQESK